MGLVAITDVQNARAQYDTVLANEVTARNNLDNAVEQLRQITGNYYPELAALIADYRKARREAGFAHTDYFFIKKDGEPLYPQLVYRVVKQALSQVCTLEKKSPHVLRHTFASVMLNNGAGLNSVKELLGHHSLASTEVYTHITFEELKQSYNQAFPKRKP